MKKSLPANVLRRVAVLLVAVTLLVCAVVAPQAEAADYRASYIKENTDLKFDISSYIDSDVMFTLPEGVGDEEEISVIITLDVTTLMDAYEASDKTMSYAEFTMSDEAKTIRKEIEAKKTQILNELDQKAISYKVGEDYDTLLTGFELVIKAGDTKNTNKCLGEGSTLVIGEVYKPAETQLVENTVNVYGTGIFNSSGVDYDGSGTVVAVLDTGLDYAHSAFSTDNFTSSTLGLTYAQVAAVLGQTKAYELTAGLTTDDVYLSEKVPFSYDYADEDTDVYSDHNNHGTHVSGVICGKDDTITGVAPNAQLVSMKVFSSVMDTARSAWILSALEDCVTLGVDVINMSLGTSAGFSTPGTEELESGVYEKIRETGISLIVAASNSYSSAQGSEKNGNLGLTTNPDTATVGSPGTYLGAMSVASINGVETPYILYGDTIMYFNETTNGASEENDFFETILGDRDSVEMEFVLVPGVGRTADYTGLDVTGKIALVRRGDNTFEEKAIIAENQGAAGILIYNNVSGDIKMNVGDATLAACSISQDMGEILAEAGSGKLKISKDQTSGPFMSDFSSWGPTPSLEIKPEITAHGGNILSAITGGAYDRMSGTSMACPNVAGVALLVRQYVVENFPEIKDDSVAVNTMINRLMMSTADIVINKNGLPYAVRKQGAGLVNLENCVNTDAIIITYDKDGKAMDKTKLELGDDVEKTGIYEMAFSVKNFGSESLTYNVDAYVMTEGVSDTLTSAGLTTVTEEGYILEGAKLEIVSVDGGTVKGSKLTVEAGKEAKVSVKLTLSEEDKQYMNESFANGMFVEGFITLEATAGTDIDMNIPYLAFYGDWTVAPMLDLDYFQTDADERDDSIPVEDKTLPDGYATRPIGGVSSDFVSYLGSYYFIQDPEDMIISANRDYIALSNQEGTIHSLAYIWAGMLRNAQRLDVTITDDVTGEVIYTVSDDAIRKSYGDGGTIRPANVEIDFDTMDYNLNNNTEYTVKMVGYMDYENDGLETNLSNTFEFPLTIDFQAPTVEDVEFRYEYDKTLKKNRLYAKIAVYDNHYAMAMQLGYVYTDSDGQVNMKAFEHLMTPVYSQKDSTTYVEYELTDYIYEIKANALNKNSFVITCYDYALNNATYEIGLPDDYTDFYFDSLPDGLTMSPNEIYSMEPLVYPDTEWSELLNYTSSRNSVVRVVNNKLVAVAPGKATIRVSNPENTKSTTFTVTVLGEDDEGYKRYDKPVADNFTLTGYYTQKAYYQLDSNEREIGSTGDTRFFEGNYSLAMYPSESVLLQYNLDMYFPSDTTVKFESSNENIVKIDDYGVVTAVAEGFSSVTVKVMMDGKSTYYSQSVTVEVKDPFINTGATLTHYFGNGGVVSIPAKLHLTSIGSFSFSNYDYVEKTAEELEFDDSSLTKQWYLGDDTITKVIIPEGVERIEAYAFANLTALEEVVLPSTLTDIDYGAFYGCVKLQKITFSGENNLKLINKSAFELCDLQGVLDLPRAYVIGDYAFAGNVDLEGIYLPETLQSVGSYAFASCKKLADVKVTAKNVKYGSYAFNGCESLKSFTVNASVIPAGMFYQCKNLESVTIGAGVNAIYEYAFRDTNVSVLEVAAGSAAFKVQSADYVISADGTTLVAVAPKVSGKFTTANAGGANITAVGRGCFSHNQALTSIQLDQVTTVGDYGFASCGRASEILLGKLTQIGEYAFSETVITTAPAFDANTAIGKYAFMSSGLTSVTIPDGMTIAEGVFSRCMDLQSVTVGNDVVLGDYAFFADKNENYKRGETLNGEETVFYYIFRSNLKEVTIGSNVTLGESAFANAVELETITLGEGANIGKMAFYNNTALKNIDLSKALSIGEYAFSGDVYYMYMDEDMTEVAISTEGTYLFTYHAPALTSVDLTSATSVGGYAFTYCRDLTDVVLGDGITELGEYAFAYTEALQNINLDKIVTVGDYCFMQSSIPAADLSGATNIGQYAFTNCKQLNDVKLSAAGTDLGEGAFLNCETLTGVANLEYSKNIGSYAFAYTAIVEADLSGAEYIGDLAFYKNEKGSFVVTLGENLRVLGDNPFAGSVLEPFCQDASVEFNGVTYEKKNYTFNISDTVYVVDGSLYCVVENGGLELITFAGTDLTDVQVADGTVRVSSMAFADSDVKMVTLPYTVGAIGHKAFYGCNDLGIVVFTSYYAPTMEEEFDAAYYETLEHVPGSGTYGDYTDYDGTHVTVTGMGLVPYFMWNATGSMYSNVFYGANFVDYVGYVDNKLMMVRPSNGQNYETYMFDHYFDLRVTGGAGMDDNSVAFLTAMNKLPERVTLEHETLVVAARAAYNKIATTEQRGLVESTYSKLLTAEQRIKQLKDEAPAEEPIVDDNTGSSTGLIAGIVAAVVVVLGGAGAAIFLKKRKSPKAENAEEAPAEEAEATEAEAEETNE